MPWILPTSFEDPGDEWEDEAGALDGDIETFAIHRKIPSIGKTSRLYLTFPRGVALAARAYVSISGGSAWFYPNFYDGDNLYQTGSKEVPLEPGWVDIALPGVPTSKASVVFWKAAGGTIEAYVHSLELSMACPGPLKDICSFLREIGTSFIDLAIDIADFWLVGEYLSIPFQILGEIFYAGADTCCLVSGTLQTLLNGLENALTPTSFLIFFQDNFPTLYALITDPVGWFLVQLTLAFDLEPWHTQSIEFLAKWVLEEYFPALYQVWLDLADGFLGLLEIRAPLLYYLVVDPEGEIRYLIGQWFDLEPYQIGNWDLIFKTLMERFFPILWELYLAPEDWLAKYVDPRIMAVPTTIAAFLADPWGWLLDQLEEELSTLTGRIARVGRKVVIHLFERGYD